MESTLLDHQQLESFIDLGFDDYLDLLGDVIHDVPGHLAHLRAAIQQGDSRELNARAHSLRGMLSYFGCVAMTDRLARMEHHESVVPDQAAATHSELHSLWEKSLAAIKAWEKSVPGFAPADG